MNVRSRLYLGVVTFRHVATAVLLFADPSRFATSVTFEVLFIYIAPRQWAAIFTAIGVAAAVGALLERQLLCRIACVASFTVCMAWAAAFLIATTQDQRASWLLAVFVIALAAKDFLVAGAPYSETLPDIEVPDLPGAP